MKTEYHLIFQNVGKRITIFTPGEGPSAFDPSGECWGLARCYEVVTDSFTETQELVPLGKAVRVSLEDMKKRFGDEI